jgi:excisionase family DNA binding protein
VPDQTPPATFGRLLLEELRRDPELLLEVRQVIDDVRAPERLLTTREAAKAMGLHPRTVTQLARDGRIEGAKLVGTRWRFPPDVVSRPVPGRLIPQSKPARSRTPRSGAKSQAAQAITGATDRKAA